MTTLRYIILAALLTSCTVIEFEQSPNSTAHVTVMPATQTSVLSAADGQWSDRAQRAGEDAASTSGDLDAQQAATAVPTVTIPLTGMTPEKAASKANELLSGGEALPESVEVKPEETEAKKDDASG